MEQRKSEQRCGSSTRHRLHLCWLFLVTCSGLALYSYFQYYYSSNFSTTIIFYQRRDHNTVIGDSPTLLASLNGGLPRQRLSSRLLTASNETLRQPSIEDSSTVSPEIKQDDAEFLLASEVAADSPRHLSHPQTYHTHDEQMVLEPENKNEVVEEFSKVNVDKSEADYFMLEMEGETNDSDSYIAPDANPNIEISTSEFGVVFADLASSDNTPDEEPAEEEDMEDEEENEDNPDNQEMVSDLEEPGSQLLHNQDKVGRNETRPRHSMTYFKTTREVYGELLMAHIQRSSNHSNPHCSVQSLFHSWQNGMVTQMGKPLKRDCQKLRKTPLHEMRESNLNAQLKVWKSTNPWEAFALKYKKMSCDEIRDEFRNNFYVSQVEKDFPIAYIFVVYTNAGQVLRLLKSVYRPHNLYCIHPDARQGNGFKKFFTAVAKCLDNVFVVSKPVRVYYGHMSITNAQLQCMQDLDKYPESRWKYAINLCGREIPIKTNREIVKSLLKLKGYTALNLHNLTPNFWTQRFMYKFALAKGRMRRTHHRQKKPPKGIKLYKSMNFIAASRAFVNFLLHHPLSHELHSYLWTVYAPEEHFYSSLYALPQAKGGQPPTELLGKHDIPTVDNFIWVNRKWQLKHRKKCCPGGKRVHGICILTALDLGKIEQLGVRSRQPVFFFNKYFLEWDPTPMDCMEERLVQANMDEYRRDCMTNM